MHVCMKIESAFMSCYVVRQLQDVCNVQYIWSLHRTYLCVSVSNLAISARFTQFIYPSVQNFMSKDHMDLGLKCHNIVPKKELGVHRVNHDFGPLLLSMSIPASPKMPTERIFSECYIRFLFSSLLMPKESVSSE